MWPLLLCQLLFGALVAFGPTIDDANRIAGLVSIAIVVVVSSAVASISTSREPKLGLLALTTIVVAAVALPYTDGHALRGMAASTGASLMAANDETRLLSPHILGLAVGAPALFLASLVIHADRRSWLRGLWLLGAVSGVAIVGLSDSRDAAIATAGGMLVIGASRFTKRRGTLLLGCGILVAAAGLGTVLVLDTDAALRERRELWSLAMRFIADSPVGGLGYGGLSGIYHREFPGFATNAHNLFIQTAADFGLIGVTALILTVMVHLRRSNGSMRRSSAPS